MMFSAIGSSFLLISVSILSINLRVSEAIVNGQNAEPGQFPFLVSLRNQSGNHYCAGSLVTRKHIVTSAQCIYEDEVVFNGGDPVKLNPERIKVVVGALSTKQGGDTFEVESYVPHPKHNIQSSHSFLYDIAVIVLKQEVNTPGVKTIPLSSTLPEADASGTIAGWGYLDFKPESTTSTDLKKLQVQIQDKETCKNVWQSLGPNVGDVVPQIGTENILCALPTVSGAGACVRDSGDPLIMGGELFGILVGGYPCATGVADLFTAVSGYQDFVNGVISAQS